MRKLLFLLLGLSSHVVLSQSEGSAQSVDSCVINFRTFGSEQPMLIINGGPGMNSNGFEYLAKKLSSINKTIIYDQRGTGKSSLSALNQETVNMRLMIADIEAIRKELKIEKWIVFGHSFGGMLASYYASLYPQHIEKLILSSSGGVDLGLTSYISTRIHSRLSEVERDSLVYWNSKIAAGDTTYSSRLGRGRALAPAYLYNRKHIPLLAKRLTEGNSIVNNLIWDDLRRIKFDCKTKLKSFKKPVLIIQGKHDIILPKTGQISHETFKNSTFVLLDHCGHYGWLDSEQEYFYEIAHFLKTN